MKTKKIFAFSKRYKRILVEGVLIVSVFLHDIRFENHLGWHRFIGKFKCSTVIVTFSYNINNITALLRTPTVVSQIFYLPKIHCREG